MSYIGQIPLPQATEERIERTATAGQTLFTGLTYVNGHISTFINGVKLDNADFTATDGTTVTLATGAAAGDTVSFVSTTQTSALVALPLKDSAGNSILSESSGTVTLGNATLDSSVTYQKGIFNFQKSIVTSASMATTTLPFEATTHGSHSHQFKTTDAQVVISCVSTTRLYESSALGGAYELTGVFALRHSLDSYASNLVTNGMRFLEYAYVAYGNKQLAGTLMIQWIYTPTRSVDDTITYKIYMTSNSNVDYIDTNSTGSNVIWTSYEVGV